MFGSSPSGKTATLTPAPSASDRASGAVEPGSSTTCMSESASGSMSGLEGSDGQICVPPTAGTVVLTFAPATTCPPTAAASLATLVARLGPVISVSGMTAPTRGFAPRRDASAAETVVETALISE